MSLRARLPYVLVALVAVGFSAHLLARRVSGPTVHVVRPARRTVIQTVVASGRVMSPGEVNVGSTLGGLVRAVHVREGQRVLAGEALIELDDAELAAQVAQARAGVLVAQARVEQLRAVGARVANESERQAEANLRVAEAAWSRQTSLHRVGAVSDTDQESAERALTVARSQLQAARVSAMGSRDGGGDARVALANRVQAEAALRVAEARAAQARIRAPAAGVILRRAVEPGDVVSAGRALLVLLRDGPTELSATPDERNLADLRLGQHARASAEAFPEESFDAELSYLAPAVDAQRGTVEMRLRVPSPPPYLRPAMTVSIEVEVGRHDRALALSADAVRDATSDRPWALVAVAGRAERRPIQLGLRGDRVVEVTHGLHDGDAVIPANAPIVAGQRVRVER